MKRVAGKLEFCKPWLNKGLMELIDTVDHEAFNYINSLPEDYKESPDFDIREDRVGYLFSWGKSPQGWDYWSNMSREVGILIRGRNG